MLVQSSSSTASALSPLPLIVSVPVSFSPALCPHQQQDIARGRGMVDELFQGWGGTAGTANAVLTSSEYLSQAAKTFNNIEDGFYISPAFLDKITIHIAKNFMDLPKIKVPLILGIWGGKGQVSCCVREILVLFLSSSLFLGSFPTHRLLSLKLIMNAEA